MIKAVKCDHTVYLWLTLPFFPKEYEKCYYYLQIFPCVDVYERFRISFSINIVHPIDLICLFIK